MQEENFFEDVYKNVDKDNLESIPWATLSANVHLVEYIEGNESLKGKKALVIGCGLGDDAEILAKAGYAVDAIDISETAICMAQERFPELVIDFRVEDIFKLPSFMQGHYDLVFESRTIQSLDPKFRDELVKIIADMVKEDGELLVHTNIQDDSETFGGPPWPLYRRELDTFQDHGLKVCYNKEKRINRPIAPYDVVSLFKREGK
jgi:SAM-dependent methyltransferase